jgi:hypothetical protein
MLNIILGIISLFCLGLLFAEILSTYRGPKHRIGDLQYDFRMNFYRMAIIIIVLLGVYIAWLTQSLTS